MTPSSKDVARAILARVRSIGAVLNNEPFLSQTEWLLLPIAKQEVALRRLTALRAYDALENPNSADALRAAKAAGVAIARFYQLLGHWRAHERSPFSLVPHQTLGMERPTRLADEDTARAISTSISTFLEKDPLAPTGRVISHVRRTWKGPGDLPSDTALRVFHERAIRSAIPAAGTLTLNMGSQPQERDIVAERFTETFVIDHVSIRGLAADEDGLPPTITLAYDLWSGSPLGAAVVAGSPEPRGVLLALQDVARRIDQRHDCGSRPDTVPGLRRKVVIATTFAKEWRELTDTLLAHGYEVIERRDAFLHQGGPTRRLLGMALGPLRLERRADRRERFGFDPRITAVQPLPTIGRLVSEAVDEMASRRVPPGAWASAAPVDVAAMLATLSHHHVPATDGGRTAARSEQPEAPAPGDVRYLLERLAEARTPGGARAVEVHQTQDGVWHLTVSVGNHSLRDAAFTALAKGAMEISASHRAPVVVQVDTFGEDRS